MVCGWALTWFGHHRVWPLLTLQEVREIYVPDLDLPNIPLLSLASTVVHHSQHTAFQQKELFFKDNLGLIFSVSISDFGLSSEDAKRAPENRGQQPLHTKRCGGTLALQSAIATVWSLMDIFPTVNYYPSTFSIGKPALKWAPAVLDDHSPRGKTSFHCLGPWILGRYLLFLGWRHRHSVFPPSITVSTSSGLC